MALEKIIRKLSEGYQKPLTEKWKHLKLCFKNSVRGFGVLDFKMKSEVTALL